MCTCADSVTDRMTRLPRIADFGEARSHRSVQLGQVRAGSQAGSDGCVYRHQLLLELRIGRGQLARADVLRVVGPVAVGADPDLEQRRLVLLDGTVRGGRERADARPRPDQRVAEGEVDLPLPPRALAVDEPLPQRR